MKFFESIGITSLDFCIHSVLCSVDCFSSLLTCAALKRIWKQFEKLFKDIDQFNKPNKKYTEPAYDGKGRTKKTREQKYGKTERRKDKKTERWKDRETERQIDVKTERQKDGMKERQKDRKMERQKYVKMYRRKNRIARTEMPKDRKIES